MSYLPALFALIIFAELLRFALLRFRHRMLTTGSRCIEIHTPPQASLASAQALWSNLIGLLRPAWKRVLLGQPHLVFEYVFDSGGMRLRLWVPGAIPAGLVEHAIEAAWPSARTTLVDTAIAFEGHTVGGVLALARGEALPLRSKHDTDPLRALIGATTGMPVGQQALVQILARPATGHRLRPGRAFDAVNWILRELLDLITPGGHASVRHTPRKLADTAEARAVRDKAQQSRYEVAIRYSVTTCENSEINRNALRGRGHAIASAFAVFSGFNRLERQRLRHPDLTVASRRLSFGQLMSVTELAALAHLPLDTAVPGLRRAGANSVPPSPAISYGGPYAKTLGDADSGHARPVALRVADACHHVHVMGPNGTGKSTLLGQMILSDITAGRGVVVIEAKGDLITDLLGLLPEEAASKVVLIDPDDQHPRPALNVLQASDADMATDNLVGIFHKIYADFWGPRTDDILRNSCLTLARRGGTLADVPTLLTDPMYRQRAIAGVQDPLIRSFWTWYLGLSDAAQAHVTGPVMNKLRAFLLRPFVRDILGSARSTFDLGRVLDGGILLVRLPKGVLGDDTARLLGSLILAQVWQAAAHRAKLDRARSHAALYVDECHNFLTLPHALSDMLAEARAYKVSLTLAHQHLAQLPRDLRQAISSDARNKVYFALSPEDASAVEHHFLPYLTAHDLANFDAYQAAARLVARSAEAPPFTLRTRPLPDPSRAVARDARAAASAAFGRTAPAPTPSPDDPRLGALPEGNS